MSLSPSVTRMMMDLNSADHIIGRTMFCPDLPHTPPVIGTLLRINTEQIIKLDPSFIICSEEDGPTLRLQPLRMAKLSILELEQSRTFDDITKQYLKIANAVDTEELALEKINGYNRRLSAIETSDTTRPDVILLLSINPPIAATSSSFIGAIIESAGGRCAVNAPIPWMRLTAESLVMLRPAILLVPDYEKPDAAYTSLMTFCRIVQLKTDHVFFYTPEDYVLATEEIHALTHSSM